MKRILQPGTLTTVLALALLAACGRSEPAADPAVASAPGLSEWPLPVGPGSAQADLALAPDGRLLLSWLDSQAGRRTRLQYADFDGARWQGPKTIGIGASFVVNWADTPHIMATSDGALWVQWLQKSAESGAAAYDVVISTSRNDGMQWSEPVRPHTDGTITEHGFAALWPQGNDRLGLAWLDGRNTAGAAATHDGHNTGHAGAAMTLRSAVSDGSTQMQVEVEIDASVCDCCQTDAAMTSKGPLLVYRGRSAEEIRDIRATRFDGKAWSAAKPVFADHWTMSACPVNGPAVAARDNDAVVGWYTAAGDVPTIKLARSADAGDSFAAPVVLEQGAAVQGRIDVALDANGAWALWVREDAGAQSLWLARYTPDLSRQVEKVEVAKLQGRGRGTGFPQLVLREGRAHMVWTDVANGSTSLHGAIYTPKP